MAQHQDFQKFTIDFVNATVYRSVKIKLSVQYDLDQFEVKGFSIALQYPVRSAELSRQKKRLHEPRYVRINLLSCPLYLTVYSSFCGVFIYWCTICVAFITFVHFFLDNLLLVLSLGTFSNIAKYTADAIFTTVVKQFLHSSVFGQ